MESKLDEERKLLIDYQKEVRSDELAKWQLDLKKNTDEQIKSELNEMKRLQQARKNNKWYTLNVGVGSLKGITTESELKNRIDVLESELKSRKTSTYKDDYEKAKKEWEDAKKKLSEIEKDKSKFTSKQYEEAKKREETAEDWETEQGGKLTDKQEEKLGTWASNAAKKRESDIDSTSKAKLEADKKAWQEYFIEYGNYQEKRKNLVQKYNDELAKLQKDSPEYAIKEAEKSKAIEQLDEQYGKSTKAM
ncbi:hypothetical protein, partial [Megasphaera sp.]|uniref:hypothetical protein n=1 Tax=Megasphaera sp. TaxID=2023260 RepID=UPI003079C6D6